MMFDWLVIKSRLFGAASSGVHLSLVSNRLTDHLPLRAEAQNRAASLPCLLFSSTNNNKSSSASTYFYVVLAQSSLLPKPLGKMPGFIDLSPELKGLIFGHLTEPSDLEAAYTTCRDFYSIIVAQMYRTLELSDGMDISKLSRMLNPDNEGLQHVRHVCIRCSRESRPKNGANTVLDLLVNHLPRDNLLSMRSV